MTPNAKWSLRVCEAYGGRCGARIHDPRCRLIGEHAHHINYKRHIPAPLHFTVVENGIWLSLLCHDLAHDTHNDSLPPRARHIASVVMRQKITELFPYKPELLLYVPLFEEAA